MASVSLRAWGNVHPWLLVELSSTAVIKEVWWSEGLEERLLYVNTNLPKSEDGEEEGEWGPDDVANVANDPHDKVAKAVS